MEYEKEPCGTTTCTVLPKMQFPVRRRLDPEDSLFDEGTIACNMNYSKWTMAGEDQNEYDLSSVLKEFVCYEAGCKKTFDNITSYERHYHMEHRYRCATCKRLFPNNHLLDVHVAEWHDALFQLQAQQKPMYRCLLAACDLVFMTTKQRKDHMIKVHKYPSNFRFDRNRKVTNDGPISGRQNGPGEARMETNGDLPTNQTSGKTSDVTRGDEPMTGVQGGASSDRQMKEEDKPAPSRFTYSYKVPKSVCFGQGSQRGFHRPRGKSRHWHQVDRPEKDTSVNIENVDMKELLSSMDS